MAGRLERTLHLQDMLSASNDGSLQKKKDDFMQVKSVLFYLAFAVFGLTVFVKGQSADPDSALQNILSRIEGENISLDEAVRSALKNAVAVRKAEASYLAATGSLRRERGYFDPMLFFNMNYENIEAPAASFFAGAQVLQTKQLTSQTGLKLDLPTGTQFQLSLNTTNLKTNSQFAFLNPEYDVFGSLSFRQQLLGGFTASARKNLTGAELAFEAAQERYNQEVIAVKTGVEVGYWNLYTAERDYAVQKLTRDRADAFLKETELRQDAGLVGPSQVANAKTFLAQQELLLIDMQEAMDSKSDQLASITGTRPANGGQRFIAGDVPPSEFSTVPVNELLEYVKDNNLSLKAAQKETDAAEAMVSAASWEALPKLDLVGSLSSTGLGGEAQDVIFNSDTLVTTSGGSFGRVLGDVFKRKYPGWSVGIELSMPIGLRSGFGEKQRLEAQAVIVQQQYVELSRNIEEQVRKAYRELSHGKARLQAAEEGVKAAEEQVRIGMIEFENGRITAFELVRLSEDLAVTQRSYSNALIRTINAVAMLRQLTSGKYPAETSN